MGMDLKPMRPTKNLPRNEDGKPKWERYNLGGWLALRVFLHHCDCDLAYQLPDTNDGDRIDSTTCKRIADLIEANEILLHELNSSWLLDDVSWWRNCGGCRVY